MVIFTFVKGPTVLAHDAGAVYGGRVDFGTDLRRRIEANGLTLSAFAKRAKVNPGIVSLVMRGQRKPPMKHLMAWADALSLDGFERDIFIIDAVIAAAPNDVGAVIRRWGETGSRRRR